MFSIYGMGWNTIGGYGGQVDLGKAQYLGIGAYTTAVMLIEHVMEMVMNLSHRVIVLDYGRKIAEGAPRSIVKNPEVINAYLGERYARVHAGELDGGSQQ